MTDAMRDLVAEVSAIATRAGRLTDRAHALLEPLRRLVAFDAVCLTLLDPERQRHYPLMRYGYPERVNAHMDSAAFTDNLRWAGMHHHRDPLRVKDFPCPPEEIPGWGEYMLPAGFGEGLGVPLHTADDRYVGQLAVHTESRIPPSDAVRNLFAALAPLIAHAVDPLRTTTLLASLVTDATAGAVLTRTGDSLPLPGLPSHRLLTAGTPVLREAAAQLAADDAGYTTFLTPIYTDQHRPDRYVKTSVLRCADLPPGHLHAVVLLSPSPDLRGLTHPQLSLLGRLLAGWEYRRVAAYRRRPVHTIVTALDDIRTTLAAPTRDAAVLRAASLGLYLPPALTRTCH